MKQKPRWMLSVIEAAKAESAVWPQARRVSGIKTQGKRRQTSEVAKP